jgi:hypothetical protein
MPKVAAAVESLDAVAEPLRANYVQGDDGKFYLDLEGSPRGHVPADRLKVVDEFRENNKRLMAEAAELKAKYGDLDPDAARKALAAQQEQEAAIGAKKLLSAADAQALIDRAVQPLAAQVATEHEARTKAEKALLDRNVDSAIISAARTAGELNPGAEEFLVGKARAAGWTMVDGKLVQQANGSPAYSTAKPGQLRTIDEWVAEEALPQAGFAWRPSVGGAGGVPGPRLPGDPGTVDPNDKKAFEANIDAIAKGAKRVGPLR